MIQKVQIEFFTHGDWHPVGSLSLLGDTSEGFRAATRFEYHRDHAAAHLGRIDFPAVSVRMPVHFGVTELPHWPPWALDLIPAGSARHFWLNRLKLSDSPNSLWPLLMYGASNPPGNLRVKEASSSLKIVDHPGFAMDDVVFMHEGFIDHCEKHGAAVSGSSGAQGEAKKFLLTEDKNGRWHPSGSVPKGKRHKEWLVKFPRYRYDQDHWVLEAEAAYHKLAKQLGFKKYGETFYKQRCLFVERFDCQQDGLRAPMRFGLESMASVLGHVHFGKEQGHLAILEAIKKYSTDPQQDIREYILRDIFNLALGNKDNHCRNTAFWKPPEGGVLLSPWYDFCPMVFDSVGVSRVNRWGKFEYQNRVNWGELLGALESEKIITQETRIKIRRQALGRLEEASSLLSKGSINSEIQAYCQERIARLLEDLNSAKVQG